MARRVAILGGGVGGLSAAHELVERGFEVDVFEAAAELGGKAKSNRKPGTGAGGRDDLPGEHGFRFFPGFYQHIVDTLRRIPLADESKNVEDNLVATEVIQLAREGKSELLMPVKLPASPAEMHQALEVARAAHKGLTKDDIVHFVSKLLVLMASCRERRFAEYEKISWWDFIEADSRSSVFQNYFANGLTRSLVAAQARRMSSRTGGYILLQLLFDLVRPGTQLDRVLNGPTTEAWIAPWVEYLSSDRFERPVEFHTETRVEQLHLDGRRMTGFTVSRRGTVTTREGYDYYIAAFPVEVMRNLITESIRAAAPSLTRLDRLHTAWMNGIQYYLNKPLEEAVGHTLYIDSPWALTSISQIPFWKGFDLQKVGDGRTRGILSVDISDWNTVGRHGRAAKESTFGEIRQEVWEQLKDHINDQDHPRLDDDQLVDVYLDPAIEFPEPNRPRNREQLLVNTVDTWEARPPAVTEIPNLMLAADYVQTFTDLATMEAANEAARQAVNGILNDTQSDAPRCEVWPLREPKLFAPFRWLDRRRFLRHGVGSGPGSWTVRLARWIVFPLWNVSRLLTILFRPRKR